MAKKEKVDTTKDDTTITAELEPKVPEFDVYALTVIHAPNNHKVVRIAVNSKTGETGPIEILHETESRGEAQMSFKIEVSKHDIL